MGKRVWLAAGVLGTALLILILGPKANAWTEFRSGNSAAVPAGQTLDSSLWAGARDLDIAGTVNGDVFCGGQTINISGTVKGDLICGGQTININGVIEGSVRLGAQTVNLNGQVGRNATIAAQTINTDSRSRIAGDASLAASDTNLNGTIGRDLVLAGQNATLSGTVGRDIKGSIKQLNLASGANVAGGIDYTSKNKASIASGAVVSGTVTQHQPKARNHSFFRLLFFGGVFAVVASLMLIISALIITALFPQVIYRVSQQGKTRPWTALLTGLAASIAVPILFFILMVSVIGIPLAILLILGWLLVSLSAGLFSAFLLGRWIWGSQRNPLLIILAGSIALIILYFIPFLNIIAVVLAAWLGEGMLLLQLKSHLRKPNYQVK